MPTPKIVALDTHVFPLGPELEALKGFEAQIVSLRGPQGQELLAEVSDADVVLDVRTRITPEVISAMKVCRVIARYGIGVDTVNVEAATRAGIVVANVPDFCWDEAADTTLSLLLAAVRKVTIMDRLVKAGEWDRGVAAPIHKLRGALLGLVGFGHIGRAVAKRAKAFGMEVVACDPCVWEAGMVQEGVRKVELDELLRISDVVSLHVPLTDETRGLISVRELSLMKPGAVLINTSRGPVVSGRALYEALRSGRLAAAGLDVLEKEPPEADDPLIALPNVVITPHYGGYTVEAYEELQRKVGEAAARALEGKLPEYVVNRDAMTSPDFERRYRKIYCRTACQT